ncbi:Ferric reductase like transmembrane component [Rhizoctonia solani]|uniref:ferric-chelate reductase (NADPH) n=1 Tax=Rhizoctonia solani TaxID=456999 RepID=A0A8H8NXI3_9AGAM|nr:Ferric reductase like transmembrane component [Rhizoctonia solani]QRW20703.1 Ferric reductase like transmembrane component [Rhizoctonia solani]
MAPILASNESLVLYLDAALLFCIFLFAVFGFPRLVARLSLPHCEGFVLRNAKPLATKVTLNDGSSLDDKAGSDESNIAPYKVDLTDAKSIPDRNKTPKLPVHIPSYSTWLHPISKFANARYDGYSVGQYTVMTTYMAGVAVAMFLFSNPVNNCTRAGFVCISQAPIVVLFGVKNGPVGTLLGKGYEKLNYIHRWVGQLMFVSALFHVVGYLVKWTKTGTLSIAAKRQVWGWFAFGGLVFLTVVSLPPVRRSSYTIFWHAHWIGFLLFGVSIMYHAPGAIPYAIAALSLYALDQVLRLFKSRIATATITPVPALKCTQLSIPEIGRGWRAGQHVRVRVLNSKMGMLGWAESHPFTIASISSPKGGGDGLTLLVKKAGDWTNSLYSLSQHVTSEESSGSGSRVKVVVEGPYGGPGSTIPSSFSSALVVVGGSGITFGTSTVEELVAAAENGCTRTKYAELVWVVQDHSAIAPLLPAFATLLSRASDAHMTLTVTVHYTRATDVVPAKLPFGIRIVAGRPNVSLALENVLKRTEMTSTPINPAKGVMIGVCGPTGLAEEVWQAENSVDGEIRKKVGGVEVYEDETGSWGGSKLDDAPTSPILRLQPDRKKNWFAEMRDDTFDAFSSRREGASEFTRRVRKLRLEQNSSRFADLKYTMPRSKQAYSTSQPCLLIERKTFGSVPGDGGDQQCTSGRS